MRLSKFLSRHLFRRLAPSVLFVLSTQSHAAQNKWITTWAASPARVDNSHGTVGASKETYTQFARLSLGGSALRLSLSNEFGTEPLTVSAVSVSLSGTTDSPSPVSFHGTSSVTIPAGAFALSDSVSLKTAALSKVAVRLTIPQQPLSFLTSHPDALEANLAGTTPYSHCYFLKAIDVLAPANAAAIVALGDSITDGHKSTPDADARWTNILAKRLQANADTNQLAVVNAGISGNRLLGDLGGPAALARFDRDVLGVAGVRYLILLEGINDIGHLNHPSYPGDHITAEDLTFALSQLIERAHSHGILVFVGTLTPYPGREPDAAQLTALEQAENDWIRHNKEIDGVIDFNAMTHDPEHPDSMLPAYDSGDHLHPGDAGYNAMANGIDLRLFTKH